MAQLITPIPTGSYDSKTEPQIIPTQPFYKNEEKPADDAMVSKPQGDQLGAAAVSTSVFNTTTNNTIVGGSTPGGSNTQVQFNDGGTLGGDASLTYNKTTNVLTASTAIETPQIYNSVGGSLMLTTGGADVQLGSDNGGNVVMKAAEGERFIIFNDTSAQSYRTLTQQITTNASANAFTLFAHPESSAVYLESKVVATRTGGTGGSAGDSAAYIIRASYKRVGAAAPTLMGAVVAEYTQEDQAGWDCTYVISGNDIQLQVTGALNNNVTWVGETFFISTYGTYF